MKKLKFLPVLLIVICFANLSVAQLTQQQTIDKVLNEIIPADTGKINLYFALGQYTNTDSIQLPDGNAIVCPFDNNFIFFVNDHPFANWNHPCRYIFIDTITGGYNIATKTLTR